MAVWHYTLGLTVFTLVWVRLLARLAGSDPVIAPPSPAWQNVLATGMHWALYALMIALPLLGWLTLSARGTPVPFYGMELPALIGTGKAQADWWKEVHETTATVGYFLVGLHAAAALYHHYFRRDNTLRLMWLRSQGN
jgi:cytochrome b561